MGMEGIGIKLGIHALIANSPEEFARQISKACQLQKNKQLESMGRSARRFVLEQYDSLEVARQLAQAYGELSVEAL
jgi:glycosyltransferase involved in cell wall biosynthesis